MIAERPGPPRADRFIWDMVLPYAPSVGNDITLVERFHAAGHAYVSLTIAGDDCGLGETIHRLADVRQRVALRPDRMVLAATVEDIIAARARGRLAVGLHLEGTECLERDPDALEPLHALGIRHAILAFNRNNSAAGGCADLGDVGLSRLGRRILDRMGSLGILLDLSHTGIRASLEAMQHHARPAVFTHSNARALYDHYRNVTDEQALACAATGGLVGLSGSTMYTGDFGSLPQSVFRHLDHFVQLIGPNHVGLGTDYIPDVPAVIAVLAGRGDEWPAPAASPPSRLDYLPPEALRDVIGLMETAGYEDAAIIAILGGNYLRIVRAVWR